MSQNSINWAEKVIFGCHYGKLWKIALKMLSATATNNLDYLTKFELNPAGQFWEKCGDTDKIFQSYPISRYEWDGQIMQNQCILLSVCVAMRTPQVKWMQNYISTCQN